MKLEGTPSDLVPNVLKTGSTDVGCVFLSFSEREPNGRDADYIEWHSLDHRPEQYRLAGLRASIRLVSTPACRAARAASTDEFDRVDHVMNYMFHSHDAMPGFIDLGAALHEADRMPLPLPSVAYMMANFAGKCAAPEAVAGADVLPWRPARGVYLLVEEGSASPESLVGVPGVAGVWWFQGGVEEDSFGVDTSGRQFTYCFLDQDPVEVATALNEKLAERWAGGEVKALLAAPFYTIVPFEWGRYVP